jgi:F-type H+-transporting ATPase subunit epsilon
MSKELSFEIVTHDGLQFQANVYEVILPSADGRIGILPGHTPLIALIVPGVIMIRRQPGPDSPFEYVATSGGFVEVTDTVARLLADTTVHASDIDELKAQQAIEAAEKLKAQAADEVTYADAVGQLELSLASLKASNLARRHRRRRHTI